MLILGLVRALHDRQYPPLNNNYLFHFSIIVPFKNEEFNLPRVIQSLKALDYPENFFEVILVDDNSSDNSVTIVFDAIKGHSNFKLIPSNVYYSGKKRAITTGVKASKYDFIVTTDADCVVQPNWLRGFNTIFFFEQVFLVFGGVKIIENGSFFSKLQAMEFSSLIGTVASTISLGNPSMGNAANMAFSKLVFNKVNGYEGNFEIASGDDEFLLRKIQASYPKEIAFMNFQDAVVSTQPQHNLKDFINQRLRWAAKLPHNPSKSAKILAWFIIIFQSSYLLMIFFSFIGMYRKDDFVTYLILKFFIEGLFISFAIHYLKIKWNYLAFITLQLIYPIYVIGIGIASNFVSFNWKGQRFKA